MTQAYPSLLLDTCALIWFGEGRKLVASAREALRYAGAHDGIFVSPISAWEIGLLARPNFRREETLKFLPDAKTWLLNLMSDPAVRCASFTPAIAVDASYLPGDFHADPADRMLVATARHLGMPIMTRDKKIVDYAELGHVRVVKC